MYKDRIRTLEQTYQQTLQQLESHASSSTDDAAALSLRRKCQTLLSELSELRRRQWEHDHDSVDMDEDR